MSSRCACVFAGAGGGKVGASAQEVLAKGLKEANHKRAHQQLSKQAIQAQAAKSLVDEPVDARESLLSSVCLVPSAVQEGLCLFMIAGSNLCTTASFCRLWHRERVSCWHWPDCIVTSDLQGLGR